VPGYCEVLPQGTYFPAEDLQTVLGLGGKNLTLVIPRNFVVFIVPLSEQKDLSDDGNDEEVMDSVVSLMEGRHELKRERLEKSVEKLLVRKLGRCSSSLFFSIPPNTHVIRKLL